MHFTTGCIIIYLIVLCAHTDCKPLNPGTLRGFLTLKKNILCFAVRLDFRETRNQIKLKVIHLLQCPGSEAVSGLIFATSFSFEQPSLPLPQGLPCKLQVWATNKCCSICGRPRLSERQSSWHVGLRNG